LTTPESVSGTSQHAVSRSRARESVVLPQFEGGADMFRWSQTIPAAHAPRWRLPHRIGVMVSLVVGILVVGACGSAPAAIRMDERDNGKTIILHPNDRFDIVLRSNPTSGYQWDWAPASQEPGDLIGINSFMGGSIFTPDLPAVGSSGTTTFYYQAEKVGRTRILFVYRPLGYPEGPPVKTFEVVVAIQPRTTTL
jgi:predicted secreted protein